MKAIRGFVLLEMILAICIMTICAIGAKNMYTKMIKPHIIQSHLSTVITSDFSLIKTDSDVQTSFFNINVNSKTITIKDNESKDIVEKYLNTNQIKGYSIKLME